MSLELPKGIIPIVPDEHGNLSHEMRLNLQDALQSRLRRGFREWKSDDPMFSHSYRINLNASELWSAFCSFIGVLFPGSFSPIYGLIDDEILYVGKRTEEKNIIAGFEPFVSDLVNNGFLQFGAITSDEGKMERIVVAPTKHVEIMTSHPKALRLAFESLGLQEQEELPILNGFPTAFVNPVDDGKDCGDVIAELRKIFGVEQDLSEKS